MLELLSVVQRTGKHSKIFNTEVVTYDNIVKSVGSQ